MATLESVADVVYDPWIEQIPLRILNGEKLAERLRAEGADILIVESDSVKGPVFEVPLVAIGSCRGDPNNVDVAGATAAGIPVLRAPGRNADAVAELTMALMFAVNRFIVPADHDVRADQVYAGGKIPYQRYRAWQLAGRARPDAGRVRRGVNARGRDAGDRAVDRRGAVRGDEGRRDLRQLRSGDVARHRRAGRRAAVGPPRRRRARPLRGRAPRERPPA